MHASVIYLFKLELKNPLQLLDLAGMNVCRAAMWSHTDLLRWGKVSMHGKKLRLTVCTVCAVQLTGGHWEPGGFLNLFGLMISLKGVDKYFSFKAR